MVTRNCEGEKKRKDKRKRPLITKQNEIYWINFENWILKIYTEACTIQFEQKRQVKTEKGISEPNARPFMPRRGCLGGGMVLESDLSTCPALESG